MCLVSRPVGNNLIATRMFIPHRVHQSIGVLGAASVAAACAIHGTVTDGIANFDAAHASAMHIEHPSGYLTVGIELRQNNGATDVTRTSLLRTARKLMSGDVFVPASTWPQDSVQAESETYADY
jgi:4-oxalomesaconate tautomerase